MAMTIIEVLVEILEKRDEKFISSSKLAQLVNESGLYKSNINRVITHDYVLYVALREPNIFRVQNDNVALLKKSIIQLRSQFFHFVNDSPIKAGKDIRRILGITGLFISSLKNIPYQVDYNAYLELFESFTWLDDTSKNFAKYILERLNNDNISYFIDYIHRLRTISIDDYEEFGFLFNSIINEYSNSNTTYSGENSTPEIINNLLADLAKPHNTQIIFDPFAGNGSTLVSTFLKNKSQIDKVFASDIDVPSCFIGALNLYVNGVRNFHYHQNDFLKFNSISFADLIVTVPPFGLRNEETLHSNVKLPFSNLRLDSFLTSIIKVLLSLNKNGLAFIVVPNSVLFSRKADYVEFRQYLIQENLLSGVIELPANTFKKYIGISASVLIIKSILNDTKIDKVFLFNGSKYTTEEFEKISPEISNAYISNGNITDGVIVNYEDLISQYYDLSPKGFMLSQEFDDTYIELESLAKSIFISIVISRKLINPTFGYPLIQVNNLVAGSGLNEIDEDSIESYVEEDHLASKKYTFIPKNSVLISKVGNLLMPTIFRSDKNVLSNPNIVVISLDENYLIPEYLITQLQSDYVIEQINQMRRGVSVVHFTAQNFKKIRIKYIPIEEQRKFVTNFFGKQVQEITAQKIQENQDDLYNLIASLKHELKQPISTIGMDLTSLKDYLIEKDELGTSISLNDIIINLEPGEEIEDIEPFIIRNVIRRMEDSITRSQETLNKAEEILNVGAGQFLPEKFFLKEFISNVILPQFVGSNCTINISGIDREIIADKYQIEVLFKRLIENAIKHGFDRPSVKGENIINISLTDKPAYSLYNEIIVENNGREFSPGFDAAKFQKSGLTSDRYRGTGFGGFHIKKIIQNHKGELRIASKDDTESSQFKVKFLINLP
ncbi:N-6 DNA methylase [Sphingobacterium kitahiroshimense]|uniref:N-6 DNA methylase n=1 Tax=Sphingobacterium sp. B16(2022) TaxID=2914044 RepID=UPI00143AB38D|nr:N-6 DNA methylase [Sphingobacterium sp. B16(2022)]NJI72724.1 N-6 DNA methylase [Sphingobacterium sp. B16(2022)]